MSAKSTDSPAGKTGTYKEYGIYDEDEDARLVIVGRIIHATWDIAPNPDGDTLRPYVYWKTDHVAQCAYALIKRCVVTFMSYFMYVFCPILLLTNIKSDIKHNNVPLNKCTRTSDAFFGSFVIYVSCCFDVTFCWFLKLLFLWQP